jgi:hypothetical protein
MVQDTRTKDQFLEIFNTFSRPGDFKLTNLSRLAAFLVTSGRIRNGRQIKMCVVFAMQSDTTMIFSDNLGNNGYRNFLIRLLLRFALCFVRSISVLWFFSLIFPQK